jgi:hypothetical protein
MTPKTCGDCSLCCTLVAVESLSKPAYTPCVHACADGGCGIYGSHPADCQAFRCGWLDFHDLGEAWRPSNCGFLIRVELEAKLLCIDVDLARPESWREPEFYNVIKEWSRMAWTKEGQVMVYVGLQAWAMFPEEDLYIGDYAPGEDLMVGYQRSKLHRRPIARLARHDGEVVEVVGELYPNVA